MHALIVAGGAVPDRAALDRAWPGWSDGVDLVVAADGGAGAARRLALRLDLVVGDGDSLPEGAIARLRRAGIQLQLHPAGKDESDAELAILAALRRGAHRLTLIGMLGGSRVDHELANILLLAHPALAGCDAVVLDPRGRLTLVRAPDAAGNPVRRDLSGPAGSLVSLLPLGDAVGVVTEGLRYVLRGDTLAAGPARGLSNVRIGPTASVTVGRGLLIVVEAPATLHP